MIIMAGRAAEDWRTEAMTALEAEETAYNARLQAVQDAAQQIAQDHGFSGYQATSFLQQQGVPAPGDSHHHEEFNADFYTVAGLQDQLAKQQATHTRALDSVRLAAREARRAHRVTLEESNAVLEAAGFDPAVVSTEVTLTGRVVFTIAGTPDQAALQAQLTAALEGVEGVSGLNTGGVILRTQEA